MKNKVFISILILMFAVSAFAQLDRSKRPEPGPAPTINIGDYESFQLENGLKVFVIENDKLPRVSFSLVIDRDPILEGENGGYVTFAGQLMRTGTETRTKDQIDEEIDFIGASFNTSATGVFGSSLKKHTEKLLDVMSDVVLNAKFQEEELEKIRKQTLSGLAYQKNDPGSIMSNVRKALTYGLDHPYGEQMTEETVNSVTLEMCSNYYNDYFVPNIAYLAIVGDISKSEAEELVNKYFGSWKGKTVDQFTYETPKAPLIRKVALVDRPNSVQSVINIAYPVDLPKGDPDVIPSSLANTILGGGIFSARLISNLREDKGYTYGAYSRLASDKLVGTFYAYCQARNIVTDSAVTEFLNEMKRMRSEKVDDELLQLAKNYQTGSFSRSLESPQTIASFALNIERYNLPKDYYKNYLKNLNAVTSDEILAVSKKYIKPNNSYVIVVGNAEEVADGLKKFSVNGKVEFYDINGNEYDPAAKAIPEGMTAADVIDNYVEAIGGKTNLEKVEDVTTKMTGKVQNIELKVITYRKAPNKSFTDLDAGVMKQEIKFDGTKGSQSGMGQVMMLEGDMLEMIKMQSTMNIYFHYDELGIKSELTGLKDVDGTDAYEVTLTFPSGKKWLNYYDAETGLKIREVSTTETAQGSFTQTVDYSDYKEANGVKYPFKLTQQMGMGPIELEVTSVEINTGLEDSLFDVE